eukprot:COSAG04_NODE_8150_length_1016_cov_0.923664_1_plen_278_part_01
MTGSPLALGALLLAPAAAQHAQHLPYFDTNLIVMEAENFTLSSGDEVGARAPSGWEAREWLHSANRFAASVADTYLSRRAYLHGPASADKSASATMDFELSAAEAGTYDVLLRYEAAFMFETPVHLSIAAASSSAPLFERIYGQRHSLKVYPFASARLGPYGNGTGQSMCGPGRPPVDMMQAECWWGYGSTEQIVWEGVGANVTLGAGRHTVTITGETETGLEDTTLVEFAERNLDVLVLSRNQTDIQCGPTPPHPPSPTPPHLAPLTAAHPHLGTLL